MMTLNEDYDWINRLSSSRVSSAWVAFVWFASSLNLKALAHYRMTENAANAFISTIFIYLTFN